MRSSFVRLKPKLFGSTSKSIPRLFPTFDTIKLSWKKLLPRRVACPWDKFKIRSFRCKHFSEKIVFATEVVAFDDVVVIDVVVVVAVVVVLVVAGVVLVKV